MRKKLKKRKKLEKKLRKKEKPVAETTDEEGFDQVEYEEAEEAIQEEAPISKAKVSEAVTPKSVKVEPTAAPAVSSALKELFDIERGDELSDRLSSTPVSDLTKAMGINEKVFTVNELFGGNSDEMNNMLTALNGLSSFEEAKSVLMRSVAAKYDWASAAKVKKAKNFIKLIQRRYN